jgi:hypothetical protein
VPAVELCVCVCVCLGEGVGQEPTSGSILCCESCIGSGECGVLQNWCQVS